LTHYGNFRIVELTQLLRKNSADKECMENENMEKGGFVGFRNRVAGGGHRRGVSGGFPPGED
jgi:hypothetical protein